LKYLTHGAAGRLSPKVEASWSSFSCRAPRSNPHYLCDEMRVEYSIAGGMRSKNPDKPFI
jgi:hypothetical protein